MPAERIAGALGSHSATYLPASREHIVMGRAQAWSAAFLASVFMSAVVLTDSYRHAGHAGATCISSHVQRQD